MIDNLVFKNRKLVIATMHGKEKVISPLVQKHLGVKTVVPKGFDTDRFGTFTREKKRAGDQLEAARLKLHAAMDMTGADLGIASEGSFGFHQASPFVRSNLELILCIDKKNGYEIRGHYSTAKTNIKGAYIKSADEAVAFANQIGFPAHGIILRKSEHNRFGIHKDILTESALIKKVEDMLRSKLFIGKGIFVETDMRAHRNPTRIKAIEKATQDLIKNIASLCPKCCAPGFVVVECEKGLKCSLCRLPTDLPLCDIFRCASCQHTDKKPVTKYGTTADPRYCDFCNP